MPCIVDDVNDVDQIENRDRLTFAAAARILGRDVKLVRREIARGRLKPIVHLDRTFVSRASVLAFVGRDNALVAQSLRSRIAVDVESMLEPALEGARL